MKARFINVREPEITPVSRVARAAEFWDAPHAVVVRDDRPVAFLSVDELAIGDEGPIATQVPEEPSLHETSVRIDFPEGNTEEVSVYYQEDVAVLVHDGQPWIVPAEHPLYEDEDVRKQMVLGKVHAFAADVTLAGALDPKIPGEGDDTDDPEVTWVCKNGDRVTQRQKSTNRICPFCHSPTLRPS